MTTLSGLSGVFLCTIETNGIKVQAEATTPEQACTNALAFYNELMGEQRPQRSQRTQGQQAQQAPRQQDQQAQQAQQAQQRTQGQQDQQAQQDQQRPQRPRGQQAQQAQQRPQDQQATGGKICRFGIKCNKKSTCKYTHPTPTTKCKFGSDCNRGDCYFLHPAN